MARYLQICEVCGTLAEMPVVRLLQARSKDGVEVDRPVFLCCDCHDDMLSPLPPVVDAYQTLKAAEVRKRQQGLALLNTCQWLALTAMQTLAVVIMFLLFLLFLADPLWALLLRAFS